MLKKQQLCYYNQHKIVETEEAMLIFGRKYSKYQRNFTEQKLLGIWQITSRIKKIKGMSLSTWASQNVHKNKLRLVLGWFQLSLP